MIGWKGGDQSCLFYLFKLDERIPERHLFRRINSVVKRVLDELRGKLEPFHSGIGSLSEKRQILGDALVSGHDTVAIEANALRVDYHSVRELLPRT